jgi:flagellar motor protein MotB
VELTSAAVGKARDAELARPRPQLAVEQRAPADAEAVARRAMIDLARAVTVREDARGTVIVLTGAALFPPNESTLLPTAGGKLHRVADALLSTDPESKILIEGYTDERALSEKRAQALYYYLVAQGVPQGRIKAEGRGADGVTSVGRASNERIEIIVQRRSHEP